MDDRPPFRSAIARPIQKRRNDPLPDEARFACFPGCSLCCSYRVLLSSRDLKRLESPADTLDPPIWHYNNGETALIRSSGFCILLDADQRCSRYQDRPDHCRSYPYSWSTYEEPELDVDLSCPGVGHGETAVTPDPDEYAVQARDQSQAAGAIEHIKRLLRKQRRYASATILSATGAWAVEEWRRLTSRQHSQACTLLSPPSSFPRFNAECEADLQILNQHLSFAPLSFSGLLGDRAWLDRHFSTPRWNTRFTVDHRVELYRFWIEGCDLHIDQRNGAVMTVQIKDLQDIVWRSEALTARFAYLERWLERQLPIRLANNLALAAPVHVAVCYLEFLLEVDWRILLLTLALAKATGCEVVDQAVVLEAVRGSDGFFRAWCESARLAGSTNHE